MSNLYDVIKEIAGDTPLATGVLTYYYIQSLEVTVDGYYKDYQEALSEYHDIAHKVYAAKWYNRWYYERKLAKKKEKFQQLEKLHREAKTKLSDVKEKFIEWLGASRKSVYSVGMYYLAKQELDDFLKQIKEKV